MVTALDDSTLIHETILGCDDLEAAVLEGNQESLFLSATIGKCAMDRSFHLAVAEKPCVVPVCFRRLGDSGA